MSCLSLRCAFFSFSLCFRMVESCNVCSDLGGLQSFHWLMLQCAPYQVVAHGFPDVALCFGDNCVFVRSIWFGGNCNRQNEVKPLFFHIQKHGNGAEGAVHSRRLSHHSRIPRSASGRSEFPAKPDRHRVAWCAHSGKSSGEHLSFQFVCSCVRTDLDSNRIIQIAHVDSKLYGHMDAARLVVNPLKFVCCCCCENKRGGGEIVGMHKVGVESTISFYDGLDFSESICPRPYVAESRRNVSLPAWPASWPCSCEDLSVSTKFVCKANGLLLMFVFCWSTTSEVSTRAVHESCLVHRFCLPMKPFLLAAGPCTCAVQAGWHLLCGTQAGLGAKCHVFFACMSVILFARGLQAFPLLRTEVLRKQEKHFVNKQVCSSNAWTWFVKRTQQFLLQSDKPCTTVGLICTALHIADSRCQARFDFYAHSLERCVSFNKLISGDLTCPTDPSLLLLLLLLFLK